MSSIRSRFDLDSTSDAAFEPAQWATGVATLSTPIPTARRLPHSFGIIMLKSAIAREHVAELLRNSIAAARAAGLRYVRDDEPGFRRVVRRGRTAILDERGLAVRDRATLQRIASLVIPPAWTDVWICRDASGHIQATGRDVRGRKQYRYHVRWRDVRDRAKFEDTLLFARALPRLRARIEHDLSLPRLSKEKVVAAILRIMEETRIRVGNDEYARSNDSYGLSTLRDRHATIEGANVELRFRGKAGKMHRARFSDPVIARIVKRCRDVPGQRLFQWTDESGVGHPVTSTDVNEYIRRATTGPFTAKEVRTWAGTVAAATLLHRAERPASQAHARRCMKAVIVSVAEQLGNTAAVCRKSYVHPGVLVAYNDGSLHDGFGRCVSAARARRASRMRIEELAVLYFFEWIASRPALPMAA